MTHNGCSIDLVVLSLKLTKSGASDSRPEFFNFARMSELLHVHFSIHQEEINEELVGALSKKIWHRGFPRIKSLSFKFYESIAKIPIDLVCTLFKSIKPSELERLNGEKRNRFVC